MTKRFSRLLTLLLASVMLLCTLPLAASADSDDYAVLGVQDGDRIILNPDVVDYTTRVEGYNPFQHKVTIVDKDQVSTKMAAVATLNEGDGFTFQPTATGISSVDFAIDGNVVATDSEYPYEFILGSEHSRTHTLTATINKSAGGDPEVETITFEGIVGDIHDSRFVNYDSGELDASNTPTLNGFKTSRAIENGALMIGKDATVTSAWLQPDVQTKLLSLGDTKLFYIDYDVRKNADDVRVGFYITQGARTTDVATSMSVATAMPADQWVHVTVVADFQRGWFSAYMNGVQFKSWSAATAGFSDQMQNNATLGVTDYITPYLAHGNDRALYIDNYAVRTYDTAQERSYSLTGISEGEEIALNTTVAPIHTRTIGLDQTAGVNKVVYKVDGEEKATVTVPPFSWDMPFTDLNKSLTVSADIYTAFGIKNPTPVSYKTVYVAESILRASNDFEDGTYSESAYEANGEHTAVNPTFYILTPRTGKFEVVDSKDKTGRDGKIMSFSTNGTLLSSSSRLNTSRWYIGGKTVFNFDIYLPTVTRRNLYDRICLTSSALSLAETPGQVLVDLSKLETDKWLSVSILVDYPAKKVTYSVGEDTYVVDLDPAVAAQLTENTRGFVHIESYNDYYLDNLRIAVLEPSNRTDSFVNGINYVKDNDSVDTTVSIANLTGAPVEANVFFALYNGNTLVKAWRNEEPIIIGANGFKTVNKDVAFTQDGETGTTVKAFCWTTDLQPIDSIR